MRFVRAPYFWLSPCIRSELLITIFIYMAGTSTAFPQL